MRFDTFGKWVAVVLVAMVLGGSARAALLYDINQGGAGGQFGGFGGNWGFDFSTSQSITVRALGLWDDGANGLANAHSVGIFSTNGDPVYPNRTVPIVSVTIDNTSIPVASTSSAGRWLFTNLASPVTLAPRTYAMGYFSGGSADPFRGNGASTTFLATTSFVFSNANANSSVFGNPTQAQSSSQGWFGPNLSTTSIGTVPEPASLGLLALGAVLMLRRKRTGLAE